jgi:hypothetical protein
MFPFLIIGGYMPADEIEKHLLSGLDQRERGFSRQVGIEPQGGCFQASLEYEKLLLKTESRETKEAALSELVRCLHESGFRQLRSRLSFRSGSYLGSGEPWVEYTDPEPQPYEGWLTRLRQSWQRFIRR